MPRLKGTGFQQWVAESAMPKRLDNGMFQIVPIICITGVCRPATPCRKYRGFLKRSPELVCVGVLVHSRS